MDATLSHAFTVFMDDLQVASADHQILRGDFGGTVPEILKTNGLA